MHCLAVGTVDLGEHQEDFVASLWLHVPEVVHAVTTDASCKIHVLLHDGHPFRMDCAQVGVFEKTDDVGLCGLLKGMEGLGLETEGVVHVRSDGSDEALEGGTR